MILRKPYAFFIKIFKPLHLLMAFLTVILLGLENKILSFLNEYINTNINTVGMNLSSTFGNKLLIIIPVILILLFLIILGIMINKKKPAVFYIVTIFMLIAIIVVNFYTFNFLKILEESIVSIKSVKLIHDLVMINILIEISIIIILIIRGLGINIKKFDFDSDISKINITESDREEFELNINVDFDEAKRKRKSTIRNLKYAYYEHKFIYNCLLILFAAIIVVMLVVLLLKRSKINKEGVVYNINGFSYAVNYSTILNTNYKNEEITKNYLVVVNTKLKSDFANSSMYLNDFSLIINNLTFKPTKSYLDDLLDLGKVYDEDKLSSTFTNYLFVFEIPKEYINKNMVFRYANIGEKNDIKLIPKNIDGDFVNEKKLISESINFDKVLGNIEFKINDYEITDKYLIEYQYCIKDNDCIASKEYLKPTLNTNFDKYILKLNVEYKNDDNSNFNSFYDLFETTGEISYKIGDVWYTQKSEFEEIKSSKAKIKDNVYIGVNSSIINASEIKLNFKFRKNIYEYTLK